jgi:YVTN family beta-propeller protein
VANATEQVTQPGTVTVIDGATHETASVVAGIQPAFVAVNTTTNRIYVLGAQANGDVTVIDGATGDTTHVAIPYGPWGFALLNSVAINEVTNRIYVTDGMSSNLLVIDGATNHVSLRPVGAYPSFVTVNPANNRVYVSNSGDATVDVLDEN